MSKYKVGDKVVVEIEKAALTDNGGGMYVVLDYMQSAISVDEKSEPLSTYTEPLERKNENKQKQIEKLVDKLHRQAAEITRLLAEKEKLKAENEKMSVKIGAYELYGDQHEEEYNQAFNQGAEAAWELARKIVIQNGYSSCDLYEIFGSSDLQHVLENYTYPEAAAKVAEWEKAKKEIKVGDVVSREGLYGVVKSVSDDWLYGITASGISFQWLKRKCTKTGRHIDIDGFLKQIGGE